MTEHSSKFRIHFGYSPKSKYYHQALELSERADFHEIKGNGDDLWHIVTIDESQIDLMFKLYVISKKLPLPKLYGADLYLILAYCNSIGNYDFAYTSERKRMKTIRAVDELKKTNDNSLKKIAKYIEERFLNHINQDRLNISQKLKNNNLLSSVDSYYSPFSIDNYSQKTFYNCEPIEEYRQIKNLIKKKYYEKAIILYYKNLKNNFYGPLHNELLYLKRLSHTSLCGRDLLAFKNEADRNDLINENLDEFVSCIDVSLQNFNDTNKTKPIDILTELVPTIDELIDKWNNEEKKSRYFYNGSFYSFNKHLNSDNLSEYLENCKSGRLFTYYPNIIEFCKIYENKIDNSCRNKGFWTRLSPDEYNSKIFQKDLNLKRVEIFYQRNWDFRYKNRQPDFTSVLIRDNLICTEYGTDGLKYTGRIHCIDQCEYFEVDLIRYTNSLFLGNPFKDTLNEILREAENILREKHNLPRIGQGWLHETMLFEIVKSKFPDAKQHYYPIWLKPQHVDIYIPSLGIAIEYQGEQHFKAIEFFGGESALRETIRRDKRKFKKCKRHNLPLIYWHYDESIKEDTLLHKLKSHINYKNGG